MWEPQLLATLRASVTSTETNCKQSPRCMWCGGGHLHKECPGHGNTTAILTCCNCKVVCGERLQTCKCRGCRHVKAEMRKRKSQRAPETTTRSHTTRRLFFAAVQCSTQQQQQPQQARKVAITETKLPQWLIGVKYDCAGEDQTRLLIREGAPHQPPNCLTVIKF
jgi:hypothetical protein